MAESQINITVKWQSADDELSKSNISYYLYTKGYFLKLWPRRDLNTQPSDLESDALPLRHEVLLTTCIVILNSFIVIFCGKANSTEGFQGKSAVKVFETSLSLITPACPTSLHPYTIQLLHSQLLS